MIYTIDSPVELGQKVWLIGVRNKIQETTVEKIILKKSGLYVKLSCNASYETSCSTLGKNWFLSLEEAEKHLK